MKGVTINDIAKELSLSYVTICKTLNKSPSHRVAKETKKKILQKAKEMGYNFSQLRHIHRRKYKRIPIEISADIIIKDKRNNNILDKGKAQIEDITEGGALITNLQLAKKCLPISSFICNIFISKGKFNGLNFDGEPARIINEKRISLGLKFKYISNESKEMIMSLAS